MSEATLVEPVRLPAIDKSQTEQWAQEGALVVMNAQAMTVTCAEDYQAAGAESNRYAGICKMIRAIHKDPKQILDKAHKDMVASEKRLLAPFEKAHEIVNLAMKSWQLAEQAKARQETERIQAELRAKEVAKRVEEAKKLDAAGKKEEALAVVQAPIVVPPLAVHVPRAQADGIGQRKGWKFRIVDPSQIRPAYLCPNEKAIRAAVNKLGMGAVAEVGGIVVEEEITIVNNG